MEEELKVYYKYSDIKPSCPICDLGYKPKKVYYIPVKDGNGMPLHKSLEVVEGSYIYKLLISNNVELTNCWIVEK